MSDTAASIAATVVPTILEVVDTFDVTTAAAWVVLVAVCVFFGIIAVGSAGQLGFLPDNIKGLCLLNKRAEDSKTVDYFLSARNSAGAWTIALSYFASGMGAWVVYGSTELGATPSLSWLGIIGYSGASAFPAAAICYLGPQIKEKCTDKAFSTTDFGRERYGRVMQLSIAAISLFYMFIYMVAELTSISNIFALLTNNNSQGFGIGVTVVIGIVTLSYTAYAGLPSSIVTDRFQGVLMGIFVIIITISVCAIDENRVTPEEFGLASAWTAEGLMAMITLILAILSAELFNQATWQRVWAAESVPAMRKGFALGTTGIFLLMMFFGIIAMIAYAKDPEAYDALEKYAYLAFFDLLVPLGNGWHVIVLILVTALAASSLDSLQNGLNAVFYRDALRAGFNAQTTATVLVVLMNIPAIWLASQKYSVLELFLVADLVCACGLFPVFLGLQEEDKLGGWLPAPTELGAFFGILSGISTVLVNGAINGVKNGFGYFWLKNGGICALCGAETMITFIVTPIMAGIMTYIFTHLSIWILGEERARRPIFELAFDKDDEVVEAKVIEEDDGEKKNEEASKEEEVAA